MSADTALLLEALTGWDAQIWMTLQAKWDLLHAMKARRSRPKVRPLGKTASRREQPVEEIVANTLCVGNERRGGRAYARIAIHGGPRTGISPPCPN